jgi:hypothetical protein
MSALHSTSVGCRGMRTNIGAGLSGTRTGVDMDTEGIFWSAWGLLSFIGLIVLLHWLGPPKDQKKND